MKHLRVSSPHSPRGNRFSKKIQDIIVETTNFNKQFVDLLRRIFVYDPKSRITAKQALKHPWFKETITDDGTEAAKIIHTPRPKNEVDLEDDEYDED